MLRGGIPIRTGGRRIPASLALAALASGLAGAVPAATAFADTSGTSTSAAAAAVRPATLTELRTQMRQAGDRLAAATVAWERGQQQLAIQLSRKVAIERAEEQLSTDVTAARQRASAFAANLYKNPYDPMLVALLSGNVSSINDVFAVRRALGSTQTTQSQDLQMLEGQRQRADSLRQAQERAALATLRLQKRLDEELARLQQDAQDSLTRFTVAVAEVRRRQAAAAAALASSGATGRGATCNGPVPGGALNGFLPISALCPLATAPAHRLARPAATAFDRMSTAFQDHFGHAICMTDSYRDYATQVQVFRSKPNLAATPGRSQHGWGQAVDLCGGIQTAGTAPYLWLKANSTAYGFVHPDWAEPTGSRPEPWHWEFQG